MYTYGPVPSRRLGRSLGVSLCPPKTCTFSCVYCQLGRTNHLQVKRENFFPKEEVLSEIEGQLANNEVDFITLAGDGEPTLSADIGWVIRKCKDISDKPVAVITNGSLLFKPEIRYSLVEADVVLPSLDAGSEAIYKIINRPHGSLNFDNMLQGQIDFRHEYGGQIWLEVMLVQDLNDTETSLKDIRKAIDQINPQRVYIMTPIRPPAETWVKPAHPEGIIKAQKILGKSVTIDDIESGEFGLESFTNAHQAILEIGSRHPLRLEQVYEIERKFSEPGTIERMLKKEELVKVSFDNFKYLLPGQFVMINRKQ